MRYWEACQAQVTAREAIAECRLHHIVAIVRDADQSLVDTETGDVIAEADDEGEYYGGDVLGYIGY
ncbi:hypothetical protein G3A56_26970 (plasmid) [Rhizobium oryzihabitans]|uniref:Uncharacterized protein n=1 Tax=Rhizobium oryzihabitans TaxID=2267833 RepID=A0A7L5BRB6_9HYPH|nr:hypothetical protein [Rhizobium oryzihabitans]QIB41442.1 hypothetical protein G3A56_26970 [Rhizobium oryzihabitans]